MWRDRRRSAVLEQQRLEDLNRTVGRCEEAVREFTRAGDRLTERHGPRGSALLGLVGSGCSEEEEAVRIALAAIHRVRIEVPLPQPEAPAPGADDVRERREERRRREPA